MKILKDKFTQVFSKNNRNKSSIVVFSLILTITLAITFYIRKNITINVDGEEIVITTYKETVEEVLHQNSILLGSKDKVEPAPTSEISKNDTINITRAVNVSLVADGQTVEINSAEDTIEDMLVAEGIAYDSNDKVLPTKTDSLKEDMEIEIVRVDIKEVKEIKPIIFETNVTSDTNYIDTYSLVKKPGKNGQKEVTNRVTYENGVEVKREVIQEVVLKEPIKEELVQGTLKTLSASRGANVLNYSRKLRVKATAYSPTNGATTAYTASGMQAKRNSNGYSTIAVDPSVIPLGTKVYVDGYGYAIAADTGTSVKGNFIDVFFNTYKEACNWGLKYVDVYIIND